MIINNIIKEKNISIYKLSKDSGIPYTTLMDIVSGKTQIEKCSALTVYKIAKALNISVENILEPILVKRSTFENFKSSICHRLKELGDIDFILDVLKSQEIRTYFEHKWYPECLYLLAMLDFVSRENNIPICDEYDDIRKFKLKEEIFPESIIAYSVASKRDDVLKIAEDSAIPEFKRFNIIENDVRNVV